MRSGGSEFDEATPSTKAPNAIMISSSLAMAGCCAHKVKKDLALLGRVESRSGQRAFDLGCLCLDQLHDMLDHVGILHMMVGHAGQIDHMPALAAASDADVRLTRFAGAVHHASKHRKRHGRPDMLQPLLESLDGADDVEALASAAGARDDANSAIADAKRLEDLIANSNFLFRLGRKRHADRVANPRPEQ